MCVKNENEKVSYNKVLAIESFHYYFQWLNIQ